MCNGPNGQRMYAHAAKQKVINNYKIAYSEKIKECS